MRFDPRDANLRRGAIRELPAVDIAPADTAIEGMVARFGAEWESFRAGRRSNSERMMLGEAMQPFLDAYERETGQELGNPYDVQESTLQGGIGPSSERKLGRDLALDRTRKQYEAARAQPGDRLVSRLPRWPTEEEIRKRAAASAKNAEDRAALEASRPGTFLEDVAGFAGGMSSVMADPVNVASMFLGAPAGAGILRFMAIEALVGAGAELATTPQVMAWQREVGNEFGFKEAATNVLLGGLGGAAFAGLFKGAGKVGSATWQRVRPHLNRDQRAAIHVTEAMDVLDRRNPFELAKRARLRGERTGRAPSATIADELRVGAGDDTAFSVELDRLAREVDETLAAARADPDATAAARGATAQPGARLSFDIGERLDAPRVTDSLEQRALHHKALQEAETSLAAGREPDGPAIRAIDEAFPPGTLELPVWQATTRNGRTTRWRGPMDIVTWARTIGGLKDDAGELAARDLDKLNRGRQGVELAKGEVFLGRLVDNDRGVSLDDAALRAWEAGFFPGHTGRPTPDDLLDAIDRTIAAGSDVDGRVWSEQDNGLVQRMRNQIDPDEEARFREVYGDETIDEAIELADNTVWVEPRQPAVENILNARTAEEEAGALSAIDLDDEAERITLEALQDELAKGDFNVTVRAIGEDGEPVTTARPAREIWQETEAEAEGLRNAAACMIGGAANAA